MWAVYNNLPEYLSRTDFLSQPNWFFAEPNFAEPNFAEPNFWELLQCSRELLSAAEVIYRNTFAILFSFCYCCRFYIYYMTNIIKKYSVDHFPERFSSFFCLFFFGRNFLRQNSKTKCLRFGNSYRDKFIVLYTTTTVTVKLPPIDVNEGTTSSCWL